MGSASGATVPTIVRLAAADEDAVREVIHRFHEIGLADLGPRRAGGCARRIGTEDEEFIPGTAAARPCKLGPRLTWWSLRRLADCLARGPHRIVRIGRERVRQVVREHGICFRAHRDSPRGQAGAGPYHRAAGSRTGVVGALL